MNIDPLIEEIEQQRLERGWSVSRLAELAGVNHSTYSKIRTGQNGATLHTVRALATALGLRPRLTPLDPLVLAASAERFQRPSPPPPPDIEAEQARHRDELGRALDRRAS